MNEKIEEIDADGGPVTWSVLKIGNRGSAYDPKGARRAFTYDDQPGNILASRLGSAVNAASSESAGDNIDRGLALLKHLQNKGFGVFQIRGIDEAGTPSSRWSVSGESDPHGSRYDCERISLAMGWLTDDELANAVFLHGNEQPLIGDLVSGKAFLPIAYLTAAKDRIRWLSRALMSANGAQQDTEEMTVEEDVYCSIADMIEPYVQREGINPDGPLPASVHDSVSILFEHWLKTREQAGEMRGDASPFGQPPFAWTWITKAGERHITADAKRAAFLINEGTYKVFPITSGMIAARQPVGQEPVAYQCRTDAVHDDFASSSWAEIPQHEYEALKIVMGGHGPKKIAGATSRGDLRIDADGWGVELRALYDAPPSQAVDLGKLARYSHTSRYDHEAGSAESSMILVDNGEWVRLAETQALIDSGKAVQP